MSDWILDLLGEVANRVQAELRSLPALEELGLSPFQAKTLAMIGRKPGSTQQALAAMMGSDKAQMARTIKELEGRSLIVRQAHQSDWRAQCLHLSLGGRHAHAVLSAQRASLGKDVLSDLTAGDLEQLEGVLTKMRARLVSRPG